MDQQLIELFLPEGILEWFIVKEIDKNDQRIQITFEEKNLVPPLPEGDQGKKVISKGFKPLFVDDFPIRGKKTQLIFLRRVWEVEGERGLLKRDLSLCAKGTGLEKEFAAFLKELDRS